MSAHDTPSRAEATARWDGIDRNARLDQVRAVAWPLLIVVAVAAVVAGLALVAGWRP
jgi:hypothetical protein